MKKRLLNHFHQFLDDHQLRPGSNAIVAVSGGIDSMALGLLLVEWAKIYSPKTKFKFVHFNHKTRGEENMREADLVCNWAKKLGASFELIEAEDSFPSSNFEQLARNWRKEVLLKIKTSEELVYTGHHIDDSFEWALMQQFRTGLLENCVGIPVKNGPWARPLMAFTKAQIEEIATIWDIPYCEDSSNVDLCYDRNFIRHEIIPLIQERFPGYLNHYTEQKSQMVELLNKPRHWPKALYSNGDQLCFYRNQSQGLDLVRGIIDFGRQLDDQSRGYSPQEIKKLTQAASRGRNGPLSMGAILELWADREFFLLSKKNSSRVRDIVFPQAFSGPTSWEQLKAQAFEIMEQRELFPLFAISEGPILGLAGLKVDHPLRPGLVKKARENNFFIQSAGKVFQTVEKKNASEQAFSLNWL